MIRRTQTAAFRMWFGDSKVVNASGRPLVVYHGTYTAFAEFDVGKEGAFFSTSKIASSYAGFFTTEGGGNVVPVYLSLKNPLIVTDPGGWRVGANYYDRTRGDLQKQSRDGGYDGIIVRARKGREDASLYVAFRPEQIKSAISNSNFDPQDPRILF